MKILSILLLLIIALPSYSQYYTSGNNRPGLKWQQIKTPVAKIVFEESFAPQALRLAAYLDSISPSITYNLKHTPKRIDLLLHNHSSYSNGFVTWAPRRTEFFAMPHQNGGSVDWLEHLAIHEYRHVVQIDKTNKGFTKAMSYLFGQQAVGATVGLHLSMWFLEGDALITETTLTKSGRGRSFDFNREIKAQLVEKRAFSFPKAYLGSYREHVPDYYKLGYLLTATARNEYGDELWENALERTGRRSWSSSPFNSSVKKSTGLKTKKLYNKMFHQLKYEWTREIEEQTPSLYTKIEVPTSDYLYYRHGVAVSDSSIIMELTGPGVRSQIVKIDAISGKSETLAYTGIREAEPITANKNMVAWSELKFHPRWEHESWSIIRTHSFESGLTRSLTNKTRYFAPSLHPHKNIIATVEATTDYAFYITIIDAQTGEVQKQIPTPQNMYPFTPSWNSNGENVVCVLLSNSGKAIYTLNTENELWNRITEHDYSEVRFPVQNNNQIVFNAKGNISDEIFSINTQTGEKHQLTESPFAAMFPSISPSGNSIFYSSYNSKGYLPVMISNNNESVTSDFKNQSFTQKLADNISLHEKTEPNTSPKSNYTIEKYNANNLINIHSWTPAYVDYERETAYTGVTLVSQNLLSSLFISAGYNANPSYSREKYNLNISYRAWFPIIDLIIRKGDDKYESKGYNYGYNSLSTSYYYHDISERIDYLSVKTGLRIPLDLSKGNYNKRLEVNTRLTLEERTGFTVTHNEYVVSGRQEIPTGQSFIETYPAIMFTGMEYGLYYHKLRRGTSRDVVTRLGYYVNGIYRHTPWGNINSGNIAGVSSRLYLPGLLQYHGMYFDNSLQKLANGSRINSISQFHDHYRLSNVISYPRGYDHIYNDKMYVFRANYSLPIWNPDAAIGNLAYIKRFRMNVFFDSATAKYKLTDSQTNITSSYKDKFSSYGGEFFADTHLLGFTLPFTLGLRVGKREFDNKQFTEFIFRTGFGGYMVN